jgi:O-antigen/teichoic acid export membrane protein
MAGIKKLFSETAYYGISSILGRMLNYALVPLHTRILTNQQDYGVVGELYAYVTFLNIFFLYGMETAYFRFANKSDNPTAVYRQSFSLVFISSILFTTLLFIFSPAINYLLQGNVRSDFYQMEYVQMFAIIIGLDALSTIPFASLRMQNRPLKFAMIRVAGIAVNVLLNLYFLLLCPYLLKTNQSTFLLPNFATGNEVYYIFLSNLVASLATLIFLYKELLQVRLVWAWQKVKPMLVFALPLMIAGLAGMMNETLDRILLKYYLPGSLDERLAAIGVYNAAYKLSIFMTLAIQAFRMAAEPYFFSINKQRDSKSIYAETMNYFVLACVIIYVGVVSHLDVLAYLLGEKYRSALHVVPILLFANLFFGIYINLSIWFKVSDKTYYGAVITVAAAVITVFLNLWLIPIWGYVGSAYATLVVYFLMMIACYAFGQIHFKVPYNVQTILSYILVALIITFGINYLKEHWQGSWLILQAVQSIAFAVCCYVAYRQILKLRLVQNAY